MNIVTLIGNLTKAPELSYSNNAEQTAVCKFTLAVNRAYQNDKADFIRVIAFGKRAETCDKYLDKGRKVAVIGRIQTGSYQNKDGQTIYTTDVIADNVEFLGGSSEQNERPTQTRVSDVDVSDAFKEADDLDIPW